MPKWVGRIGLGVDSCSYQFAGPCELQCILDICNRILGVREGIVKGLTSLGRT